MSKNFCDLYWAKETDENYLKFVSNYEEGRVAYPIAPADISLYKFAGDFTMKWQPSPILHVPKPTPMFHYVPLPSNQQYRSAYCETTLLLHKPGATPENIIEGFENAEAALLDFVVNDVRCPKIVKDEHLKSLKMTEEELEQLITNVEDLVAPQGSQTAQVVQDEWMMGLGEPIREPDINDPEPELEDIDDENLEADWDREADWTLDKQLLNMDSQQIKDAKDWIKQQRISADLVTEDEQLIDVATLNIEQRAVYDAVMDTVLQGGEQKLIDMSGGAGTGKSYLIRCMLQQTDGKIKIAAPTGCAAQQFSGGQTLHSMLRIPPKKGCKQLDELSPAAKAELQSTFKEVSCLIIDEKGNLTVVSCN